MSANALRNLHLRLNLHSVEAVKFRNAKIVDKHTLLTGARNISDTIRYNGVRYIEVQRKL